MIEIYRDERGKFRVWIDGKEIERLKSFSVSVSNARFDGYREGPSYTVEQYMPRERMSREMLEEMNRNFEAGGAPKMAIEYDEKPF